MAEKSVPEEVHVEEDSASDEDEDPEAKEPSEDEDSDATELHKDNKIAEGTENDKICKYLTTCMAVQIFKTLNSFF